MEVVVLRFFFLCLLVVVRAGRSHVVHGKTHGPHPREDKMKSSSALTDTLIACVQLSKSVAQVLT